MGDVVAEQSIARLTMMLTKAVDREVALMVLEPGPEPGPLPAGALGSPGPPVS